MQDRPEVSRPDVPLQAPVTTLQVKLCGPAEADDGQSNVKPCGGSRQTNRRATVIIPAIGESYGRRLAQFADICLLAAPPAIVAVTSNPSTAHRSHSSALSVPLGRAEAKEARFVDAFRRCTPDSGGWVHLSKFGAALKSAGVSFKGKLFEVSSLMPAFEVRGPKGLDAAIRLRGGSVSVVQIDENTIVTETVKALL